MNCPNCNVNLLMTERSGVEVDYCPECRGIWLDKGELDKLMEKSSNYSPQGEKAEQRPEYHSSDPSKNYPHKKKKENFFMEIFEGIGGD